MFTTRPLISPNLTAKQVQKPCDTPPDKVIVRTSNLPKVITKIMKNDMNERIKELVAEATSRPHRSQGFGGEPTHIYPGTLDPEKFAELIVRECVELNRQELSFSAFARMLDKYEDHFGIKE
jgi:hypothetical protein